MGYYFYYPLKNKLFVAQYAEFFENSLISQEASGSIEDFDEIQIQDAQPFENTIQHQPKVEHDDVNPQIDVITVRRSTRIPQALERYGFYIDDEERIRRSWLLKSIDDESFDVCVSCISGKMARKPFNHASKRVDDLLGIIHSDTFQNKVEDQLGKTIKALRSDRGGYPKETMGYYFYYPLKNKLFVARYAEFFENSLISKEASGSIEDFDEIQIQDAQPFENTIQHQPKVKHDDVDPQIDVIPVCRSTRIPQALERYDVKTAFLNGCLNEDVYIVQPRGFLNPKHPRRVFKLQRSIYGLKQAFKSWNKRFDEEIKKYGFTKNPDEPCVYKRASGSIISFLILYVDDILLMGNNIPMLQDVKFWLGKCFTMKDLGYVFVMNRGVVDWKSSKQSTTAMSSMEVEYIADVEVAMEPIWIPDEPSVQRDAKHFRRKYHFIREAVQEGDIRILKVHTDNNLADPFTKPMPCTKHVEHAKSIGLRLAGSFMIEALASYGNLKSCHSGRRGLGESSETRSDS
nr:retrotransposon protein, putative, Ty1-copia subclass [Tanacetum cinerariifolium]